uniref:ABC transporter domain-containing protein n=1 Tax=Macrostomum lignano TaxID=282301 RepID=A0A1I8FHN4_9PLAT
CADTLVAVFSRKFQFDVALRLNFILVSQSITQWLLLMPANGTDYSIEVRGSLWKGLIGQARDRLCRDLTTPKCRKGHIYGLLVPSALAGKTTASAVHRGRMRPRTRASSGHGSAARRAGPQGGQGSLIATCPQDLALYQEFRVHAISQRRCSTLAESSAWTRARSRGEESVSSIEPSRRFTWGAATPFQRRVSAAQSFVRLDGALLAARAGLLLILDEPTWSESLNSLVSNAQKPQHISGHITTHYIEEAAAKAIWWRLMREKARLLAESESRPNSAQIEFGETSLEFGVSEALLSSQCERGSDWLSAVPVVSLPVLQIVLFCLCVGPEPRDLRLAIVNDDVRGENYSREFNRITGRNKLGKSGGSQRQCLVGAGTSEEFFKGSLTPAPFNQSVVGLSNETLRQGSLHLLRMDDTQLSSQRRVAKEPSRRTCRTSLATCYEKVQARVFWPQSASRVADLPLLGSKDPTFTTSLWHRGMIIAPSCSSCRTRDSQLSVTFVSERAGTAAP